MDIEEAFREAAERVTELDEAADSWLEEIAMDFWRGVPEGGDTSVATRTLTKIAFVAGQIYQQQFALVPETKLDITVEEKFEIISGFIDFINNRTGE